MLFGNFPHIRWSIGLGHVSWFHIFSFGSIFYTSLFPFCSQSVMGNVSLDVYSSRERKNETYSTGGCTTLVYSRVAKYLRQINLNTKNNYNFENYFILKITIKMITKIWPGWTNFELFCPFMLIAPTSCHLNIMLLSSDGFRSGADVKVFKSYFFTDFISFTFHFTKAKNNLPL